MRGSQDQRTTGPEDHRTRGPQDQRTRAQNLFFRDCKFCFQGCIFFSRERKFFSSVIPSGSAAAHAHYTAYYTESLLSLVQSIRKLVATASMQRAAVCTTTYLLRLTYDNILLCSRHAASIHVRQRLTTYDVVLSCPIHNVYNM